MLVRAYRRLRSRLDKLRTNHLLGRVSLASYLLQYWLLRIVIQIIVTPHFMLLGPFKTFTTFARTDERGSWIDSYNDFIFSNLITISGIVSLVLIGITAILVFIYLPVF